MCHDSRVKRALALALLLLGCSREARDGAAIDAAVAPPAASSAPAELADPVISPTPYGPSLEQGAGVFVASRDGNCAADPRYGDRRGA